MRRVGISLLLLLVFVTPVHADEDRTADAVTEPGRSLERALRIGFGRTGRTKEGPRTVLLVLDATVSVKQAGFIDKLETVLAGLGPQLEQTQFALAVVGDKSALRLKPTDQLAGFLGAVREALATPSKAWQNVYDALDDAFKKVKGKGPCDVVLVTFDNGDAEGKVKRIGSALRKAEARLSIVTTEAVLCDSYLTSRSTVNSAPPPPGTKVVGGGDAAYMQLPWGWLFQTMDGHEATPSGYACFGLSQLAAVSGGRVFLYAPPKSGHQCATNYGGSCIFCSSDHMPEGRGFNRARLQAVAPLVGPRRSVLKALGGKEDLRITIEAWEKAAKLGLVRSRPAAKRGGSLKLETRHTGSQAAILSLGFSRVAKKAKALRRECEQLVSWLAGRLEAPAKDGEARYRAAADYTLAMLQITRFNLLALEAWAEEIGPQLIEQQGQRMDGPEEPWIPPDNDPMGVAATTMCLCHGVEPFFAVRLGGGERVKEGLQQLQSELNAYWQRNAGTPFGMAIRRAGIARFYPTYRGRGTSTTNRKRPSSNNDQPTTETGRPGRPGGGSSGGGTSGPTTGGG